MRKIAWMILAVTSILATWIASTFLIGDIWLGLLPAMMLWSIVVGVEIVRIWKAKNAAKTTNDSYVQYLNGDNPGRN